MCQKFQKTENKRQEEVTKKYYRMDKVIKNQVAKISVYFKSPSSCSTITLSHVRESIEVKTNKNGQKGKFTNSFRRNRFGT